MKGEALQVIRHDYHAVHSSGARPLSAVKFIVLHCMETFSLVGADEGTGSWFENLASKGSAHFGVDDDSTQQYLPLTAVAWGAPPLNYNGVHIEASGRSALDRPKWLEDYDPMLTREAWLVAHLCRELAIPLRVLDAEDLARCGDDPAHKAGIVTHETVSAVFRQSDHTDPGPGFPMAVLMDRAKQFHVHGHLVAVHKTEAGPQQDKSRKPRPIRRILRCHR